MSNVFYVYLHRRNDTNEVFYVGKGKGYRAKAKERRSKWWKSIVEKCGYTIEYVEKGLSEESAFDLEIELIKFYKDCGHPLCNHTKGGEGKSGYTIAQDATERMLERVRSEKNRKHMKKLVSKPVLCSNGETFESAKDAEIWLGNRPSASSVSSCCRRESCQAGGYVWRYLDDCEDLQKCLNTGKDAFIEFGCQKILDMVKPKTVYCDNGMVFESASLAVKWCNDNGMPTVNSSAMSRCCLRKANTLFGLRFSYQDEFSIPPIRATSTECAMWL